MKRKAKRYCPALGRELCNLCCGLLREKEIHCPLNCPFLAKHRTYQERRTLEKKETPSSRSFLPDEDILKDERMAWLALHVEVSLKEYGEKFDSFTDKDAILALEYTKEKVIKGKSSFLIPGREAGPKNDAGEAIFKSIENCRYEKTIILPGEMQSYKTEEKVKCLERIILSVKSWAKGNFNGRTYIEQLSRRFSKIEELSRQKKLITLP